MFYFCSLKCLRLQHEVSRSLKRKEQKEKQRGKVTDQYAKKKALDQFCRIMAYKPHRLNCEVEKLVAKVKVNSGQQSLIIYLLPFTDLYI